jgi:LruC domain-containing protein
MKTINHKTTLVLFSIFSLLLHSCINDTPTNSDVKFENFDFKTTKQVKVSVSTLNSEDKPIGGVNIEIYTQNPLTSEGLLKANSSDFLAFKGISSNTGTLDCEIAPQTFVDSLSILVNHIGLPSFKQVKINSNSVNVVVGGSSSQKTSKYGNASKTTSTAALPVPVKMGIYYVLGAWDSQGKPNYLWNPNDIVANDFLADVNASLPEREKLTVSHPEYLSSTDNGNIELIKAAEVWLTFVHEGAGYRNAIGYYTHKNDIPPAGKTDIKDPTIIFPNVSFNGSGGSLSAGNKVQLLYFDPVTNTYSKTFPAGTTVAWFFIADSFRNSTTAIGPGLGTFYSDSRFNPETDVTKRKHNVVLKDTQRQLLLIGFEDINREKNSDEDFNDGVFYATFTPFDAAKTDKIQPIDTPTDTDGDGVSDSRDEYPTDPKRAFNNYYPSKNNTGTLAFEDLWPAKGDYDFNDLVVDYNFNQVTNGENKVVEVNAALTVRAIGASFINAFALQFNTTPSNVKAITGNSLTKNVFALNANGTEQNQSKAVIPIFDDPYKVLNASAGITNTYIGGAYSAPKTMNIKIEFNSPIALSGFGTAPYNPFIVASGIRGKEIHLPANAPTDLADKSKFGTGDDDSNLGALKYYMSDNNLPWAINIPVQFAYPIEKQEITKAFLFFNRWAESKGSTNADWYMDKPGYRDTSKLFKR